MMKNLSKVSIGVISQIVVTGFVILLLSGTTLASEITRVIHVPADQASIQAGINAAVDGDTVLIADGTYTGPDNRDIMFYGKAITVCSSGGAENCVIDCENAGRGFIFSDDETNDSVLQGVTIINGQTENKGAGICVWRTDPVIMDCVIANCSTTDDGGGVCLNCSYTGRLVNCSIIGNTGLEGGGIYQQYGNPDILNCLILNNQAANGGGIMIRSNTHCNVRNCTLSGNIANTGGAISIYGSEYTHHFIENSIIRDCTEPQIYLVNGILEITYSNIENGYPGIGNIDLDPLYTSGPHGDYYLSQTESGQLEDSPCLNAGNLQSSDVCFDSLAAWVTCLDTLTTRTDGIPDLSIADMGYHYGLGVSITATPTPTPTLTPTVTPTPTLTPTLTPTPATIVSVLPAGGSHIAPASTNLMVNFLHLLDPDTVDSSTFVIHREFGEPIIGTFSFDSQSFTLNPASDFFCGEMIHSTVTGDVEAGYEHVDPYVWWFRTAVTNGTGLFIDSEQSLGSDYSRDIALGDLDGDGDLDVFVANDPGGSRIWLNDGDGRFTGNGQELDQNANRGVALGDLDGDGDLDAFVVNSNFGSNQVFLNDGTGFYTDNGQVLGSSDSTDVALGDLDGDGDLDAFVTNFTQPNTVWRNQGFGYFNVDNQFTETLYSQSILLGDLDNNGTLDAILLSFDENRILLNDRSGNFAVNQLLNVHNSANACLGDVDNDGDLDVFIVNSTSVNQIWLNDGQGWFTDSEQTLIGNQGSSINLADLDADGDLDAVVTNTDNSGNRIYINSGNGIYDDSGQALGNSSSVSAALGDLDGDGDMDVFVANKLNQGNSVWLNQEVTPTPTNTPGTECNVLGCKIIMPQSMFQPGDECFADIVICNPTGLMYPAVPVFVILDVYGLYLFAPSFSGYDHYVTDLPPGETIISVIPNFIWPANSGAEENIFWYAGMTDQTISGLFGSLGMFQFGWNP
ncbi:FG-GAP-like repeat-containing protein [bacterium]|nr:FG-GAP-like repeat-containing protein [bacterium]